jgi:radical SAM protein with 4Fe4S-binding SPASM domain
MFELTYRCNLRCKHCYIPFSYRNKKELKTEEVFSILDQLSDSGCFYLGFTGGEPLIRKDALKIFNYAKKRGLQTIINTNASLITKSLASTIAQLAPNKVDITLHSMDANSFDRITGVKGSYKKVFAAVDYLHKENVPLGFKTCLLRENESEINKIGRFARSLGAFYRVDNLLSYRLDGSSDPFKYRGSLKDNTRFLKTKYPRANISNNLFFCGSGTRQAAITPSGELKICLLINYPKFKIINESFASAWRKLYHLVRTVSSSKRRSCASCKVAAYCKWCPGRSWLAVRDFVSCDPELKNFARNRINVGDLC